MRLRYSVRALRHLDAIFDRIARDDPRAALRVLGSLRNACERLTRFPGSGREGVQAGTREWSMPSLPYVIVYRIDVAADALGIVAVFHTRRQRSG